MATLVSAALAGERTLDVAINIEGTFGGEWNPKDGDQLELEVNGVRYPIEVGDNRSFRVDLEGLRSDDDIVAVDIENYPRLREATGLIDLDRRINALPPGAADRVRLEVERAQLATSLELSIAQDPLTAAALEGEREVPTTVGVLRGDDAPAPATVAFLPSPSKRPGIFATKVWLDDLKDADAEGHYGWARKDDRDPCRKMAELPRWCLLQRNAAEPNLPDPATEANLLKHLTLSRTRVKLFGLSLTRAQMEAAVAYLEGGSPFDLIRKAKRLAFEPAVAMNREPNLSSEAVQDLAHRYAYDDFNGVDASNDGLLHALFLGMKPCWPEPHADGAVVRYIFSDFDQKKVASNEATPYLLPDVEIVLNDALTALHAIRYRFARDEPWTEVASDASTDPWTSWGHAKRIARLANFIHGQYEGHLVAHLSLEALQVAILRVALSRDVQVFLRPFVEGVAEVNNYGNDIIVGEFGALCRGTGLSMKGSLQYAAYAMGRSDWKDYAPRTSAKGRPDFLFARRAGAFWRFAQNFVEQTMPPFSAHQESYRLLVDELVNHAVPCAAPTEKPYIDAVHSEVPNSPTHAARRVVNGQPRALSAIDFNDSRAEQDLVQFLTFFVFQATFLHTHANDQMRDLGGDLRVAPLGLRQRGVPTSEQEFWSDYAPRPPEAALQLFLVDVLSQVETRRLDNSGLFGFIQPDDLHIHANLARSRLADVGVKVHRIRRGPVI